LPDTIQFKSGHQIINKYNAAGKKLETEYLTSLIQVTVPMGNTLNLPAQDRTLNGTVYAGNKEYVYSFVRNVNTLNRIHNAEGYVSFDPNNGGDSQAGWSDDWYHYYRRDHLGNNREVWRAPYKKQIIVDYDPSGFPVWSEVQMPDITVQRTQYYPSGLPWASNAGDNPSEQPYKHQGKEFVEMHGYDVTDHGNRGLYHAAHTYTTMDRFCEKFPGQSPYVHAGNNPVKYIDVRGDSTAVLNKGGAVSHSAMLVQNDEGKWQYYSFNGTWVYDKSGGLAGGKSEHDVGAQTFDSPQAFLESDYNAKDNSKVANDEVNNYAFKEAYILPTTPEQDNTIRETFTNIATNESYSLGIKSTSNQCANVVQRSLNAAGIETQVTQTVVNNRVGVMTQRTFNPYMPNAAFKAIINNNPNGQYIKR